MGSEVILGIHGNYFYPTLPVHESSAAVVIDGKLASAVSQERITRNKCDGSYPQRAIEEALKIAGVSLDQVTRVVLSNRHPSDSSYQYIKALFSTYSDTSVYLNDKIRKFTWYWLYDKIKVPVRNYFSLNGKTTQIPIEYNDHHLGHAAGAYYASPFDDAIVVTLDGGGDGLDAGTFTGKGTRLEPLFMVPHNQSPGTMYSAITHDLGFKRHRHEGKITGLAAYGNPDIGRLGLNGLIRYDAKKHRFISKEIAAHQRNLYSPSSYFSPLLKKFPKEDLAAVTQEIFERVTLDFIRDAVEMAGKSGFKSRNICLAGGCFANVKLNQRILASGHFDNIFIFPAMGDEGLSAGAALMSYYRNHPDKKEKTSQVPHVYLGKSFSGEEIEKALVQSGLQFHRDDNIEEEVGKLLAHGKIIGRFNGAMEYGPRALGNRSIIGAPFDAAINDWLNKKLNRTEFMPFAPSMLAEYADQYLVGYHSNHKAAEFMTITYDIKPGMKEKIPAVVHVDNTARPQIVKKEINPSFHKIISEFHKHSGCPVVLNTSFNIHEEPIVYTPQDAVRGFIDSRLDYLAIGNYLATFKNT